MGIRKVIPYIKQILNNLCLFASFCSERPLVNICVLCRLCIYSTTLPVCLMHVHPCYGVAFHPHFVRFFCWLIRVNQFFYFKNKKSKTKTAWICLLDFHFCSSSLSPPKTFPSPTQPPTPNITPATTHAIAKHRRTASSVVPPLLFHPMSTQSADGILLLRSITPVLILGKYNFITCM